MYQELLHNEAETESNCSDEPKAHDIYRDIRSSKSIVHTSKTAVILLLFSATINLVVIVLLGLTYTTQKSGDLGIDPSIFLLNSTSTDHHAFTNNHTANSKHEHPSSSTSIMPNNATAQTANSTEFSVGEVERPLPSTSSLDRLSASTRINLVMCKGLTTT